MNQAGELVASLVERYARYQSLLEQVHDAIGGRTQESLSLLEVACGHVLEDIQCQWAELESGLQRRAAAGGPVDSSWALLEAAMTRAAEQLAVNQAALAQWVGEAGATLQAVAVGNAVAGAYDVGEATDSQAFGAEA
jgi:hypothetical protein